ncbi:hypothetical protein TSO5_26210 [Azospirillum sp. TSO5]|nr:hypothetical protein TSO5_26210 [Azospirillum sp. TSO5]
MGSAAWRITPARADWIADSFVMQSAPKLTALPHFSVCVTVRSRVSSFAVDGSGSIICKNGLEPPQTRQSV